MRSKWLVSVVLALLGVGATSSFAFAQGRGGGGFGGGLGGGGLGGGMAGGRVSRMTEADAVTSKNILTPGDRNEWPIAAKAGETIIVEVSTEIFDPVVELVDADKKLLAQNDDIEPGEQDSLLLHRFEKAGSYTILVKSDKSAAGGLYTLTLRRFVARDLALGTRAAGTLGPSGVQWWRIPGEKGKTLVVSTRAAAFEPVALLRQPSGKELEGRTPAITSKEANRSILRIETTGDHYIQVGGGQQGSSYALTAAFATEERLAIGQTKRGRKLASGSIDQWIFDGEPGQVVRISAKAPDARLLAELSPGASEPAATEPLDASRTFTQLAKDPKTLGEIVAVLGRKGPFRVTVSQPLGLAAEYDFEVARVAAEWRDRDSVSASIPVGGVQYWEFDGKQGEIVRFEASSERFDPVLAIYTGRGDTVAVNDDSGPARDAAVTVLLPESGRYLAMVHALGFGGGGPVTLKRERNLVRRSRIGSSESGSISSDGKVIWTFEGKQGQTVIVSGRAEEFDIGLRLFAPDGVEVAADDDSGEGTDALLSARLPVDGVYTVWVAAVSGGGKYSLQILEAK